MSHYTSEINDEELLEELRKLGYDDVSSDIINSMKNDLTDLMHERPSFENHENSRSDQHIPLDDSNRSESISRKTKRKTRKKTRMLKLQDDNLHKENCSNIETTEKIIKEGEKSLSYEQLNTNDNFSDSYSRKLKKNLNHTDKQSLGCDTNKSKANLQVTSSTCFDDASFKYDLSLNEHVSHQNSVSKNKKKGKKLSVNAKTLQDSSPIRASLGHDSSNNKIINDENSAHKVLNTTEKSRKFSNVNLSTLSESNLSSSSRSGLKTMKRKVLRHRNGESIITEEVLEVSNIYETSYPANSDHSSVNNKPSNDSSPISNNSTGSVSLASPEATSKSSISLASNQKASIPIKNRRKKKSDPVAMYNYYKKFWSSFKPPGENTHDKLRWAIRDKMLEYNM